jgi:restriction system protein
LHSLVQRSERYFPIYKSACIWHFDRNYRSNEDFFPLETVMPRTIYTVEVRHEELGKYREIRGADPYVVQQKADAQIRQWNEMWAKRQEVERRKASKETAKELAEARTRDAQESIADLQNILNRGLMGNSAVDWESLKSKGDYPEPKPQRSEPTSATAEPRKTDAKYQPNFSFISQLFGVGKQQKIEAVANLFNIDHKAWEHEKKRVDEFNENQIQTYYTKLAQWEKCRSLWLDELRERHIVIDKRKQKYFQMDVDGVLDYCDLVLSKSQYPDWFPQQFDLEYIAASKILIVEYVLPSIDKIPTLTEVRYIQTKDEFKEYRMSDTSLKKIYDDLLYQVTLRTLHELFEADTIKTIDAIVFNGHVKTIDKSTGQPIQACILSVQVSREEFIEINLRDVDPKACFRRLKGVGSSKLHGMAAIAPIMRISREDSRFVAAYEVAHTLDDSLNIAAMDWLDFEHLIREIFEKEFSVVGGEVKITRASRDHGVDGIAFDPDPIRGGKIVIQAKRYTNPVDVAAVRDLYGTVVNEGAIKGILVTTSDYGPDSYAFAKDKPLALLNGSNLLHMLQRHGYRAKIDLKEAKIQIAESTGRT